MDGDRAGMFARRTRARLALLVERPPFGRFVREWRLAADKGESPLSLPWFLAGLGYRIASAWALDRDAWGVRTCRRWTALLVVVQVLGGGSLARLDDRRVAQNVTVGGHVGHVCYRVWY